MHKQADMWPFPNIEYRRGAIIIVVSLSSIATNWDLRRENILEINRLLHPGQDHFLEVQ